VTIICSPTITICSSFLFTYGYCIYKFLLYLSLQFTVYCRRPSFLVVFAIFNLSLVVFGIITLTLSSLTIHICVNAQVNRNTNVRCSVFNLTTVLTFSFQSSMIYCATYVQIFRLYSATARTMKTIIRK